MTSAEVMARKLLSIEDILSRLEGTEEDRRLVRDAYEFAQVAHEGQERKTGGPYVQHSLHVAMFLAEVHLDAETIAAGLLHDVVEDSDFLVEDLEEAFGPSVAVMVDGVTKLDMKFEEIDRLGQDRETVRDERELESLRKMFLAMARDARVILIKLADRLHNMLTLKPLSPDRRAAIARETMQIYAPLANRLGIWRWKWQLEDRAFRELQPDVYYQIVEELDSQREEREADIEHHIALLRHHLWLEGIKATIDGRPKHIYSIYRKMRRKHQVDLEHVYDIQAIRVIVDTIPECYQAIGVVHGLWTPIHGEFDDYIATPKENGYQSLHTAVVGLDGKTLEVQIRTQHMHRVAENGIAAHWQYKEGNRYDPVFEKQIANLRAQIEAPSYVEDPKRYVEEVTADLFQDRVYTLTPQGQVIDLPAGATPVDFAYYIHTEIGHRARGAKVNGQWVGLDYVLSTGDQVEIITTKKESPSRDWLNPALGYVKTSRARSKIRQWLRKQDREKNITIGRSILERELKRMGVGEMSHEAVASLMGYDDLEDFLAAIGFGDVHSQHIASKVLEAQREQDQQEQEDREPRGPEVPHDIHVLGTGGFLTRLAQCCSPLPGDPIVGYVTRGRGITIHRRDCSNIIGTPDSERLIEVSWGTESKTFSVPIQVQVYDRRGLLHDISGVIKDENLNISTVSMSRKDGLAQLYMTLEVEDVAQLGRIMARVAKLPNVVDVRRQT